MANKPSFSVFVGVFALVGLVQVQAVRAADGQRATMSSAQNDSFAGGPDGRHMRLQFEWLVPESDTVSRFGSLNDLQKCAVLG